jgi:hypothetical protein
VGLVIGLGCRAGGLKISPAQSAESIGLRLTSTRSIRHQPQKHGNHLEDDGLALGHIPRWRHDRDGMRANAPKGPSVDTLEINARSFLMPSQLTPSSGTLSQRYESQPIEFVYLCYPVAIEFLTGRPKFSL